MCGYGYGGFWTPTHIKEVSDEEKWAVPDGHSAYLDFLLTLGVTGLAAYVLILAGSVRRAFLLHANSRNSAFAFYGAILLFCAVDGLFESAFIEPGFPMFICMIIVFQSTDTPVEIRHNPASYIPIRTALL
jgi:O-antigen ligase